MLFLRSKSRNRKQPSSARLLLPPGRAGGTSISSSSWSSSPPGRRIRIHPTTMLPPPLFIHWDHSLRFLHAFLRNHPKSNTIVWIDMEESTTSSITNTIMRWCPRWNHKMSPRIRQRRRRIHNKFILLSSAPDVWIGKMIRCVVDFGPYPTYPPNRPRRRQDKSKCWY